MPPSWAASVRHAHGNSPLWRVCVSGLWQPFHFGSALALCCCVFQNVDGGIMAFILEEDRIVWGGSISHAQVESRFCEIPKSTCSG
jgi:hypothetical protein